MISWSSVFPYTTVSHSQFDYEGNSKSDVKISNINYPNHFIIRVHACIHVCVRAHNMSHTYVEVKGQSSGVSPLATMWTAEPNLGSKG